MMRPKILPALERLWFRFRGWRWTQAEVDAINERAEMRYVQMMPYFECNICDRADCDEDCAADEDASAAPEPA